MRRQRAAVRSLARRPRSQGRTTGPDTCIGENGPSGDPRLAECLVGLFPRATRGGGLRAAPRRPRASVPHLHFDQSGGNHHGNVAASSSDFPQSRLPLLPRPRSWEHWSAQQTGLRLFDPRETLAPNLRRRAADLVPNGSRASPTSCAPRADARPTPPGPRSRVRIASALRPRAKMITGESHHHPGKWAEPHLGSRTPNSDGAEATAGTRRPPCLAEHAGSDLLVDRHALTRPRTRARLVRRAAAYPSKRRRDRPYGAARRPRLPRSARNPRASSNGPRLTASRGGSELIRRGRGSEPHGARSRCAT